MITKPEDLMKLQAQALQATGDAAAKTLEGFQRLAELNMQTARATLEQSSEQISALLAARDTKTLTELVTSLARPQQDQFSAYAKAVFAIYQDTGAELGTMVEKQVAQSNRQLADAVETFAKTAPAGSEGAVAFIRQSLEAARSAYDQVNATARQFADVAEGTTKRPGARR
ncbi:MAG: hypothetical protein RI906_349 [Pseudomonadota bacterium]|jgi:phasin family protein